MPREVRSAFNDEEFADLKEAKGDRTWRETLLMDVAGYERDEV